MRLLVFELLVLNKNNLAKARHHHRVGAHLSERKKNNKNTAPPNVMMAVNFKSIIFLPRFLLAPAVSWTPTNNGDKNARGFSTSGFWFCWVPGRLFSFAPRSFAVAGAEALLYLYLWPSPTGKRRRDAKRGVIWWRQSFYHFCCVVLHPHDVTWWSQQRYGEGTWFFSSYCITPFPTPYQKQLDHECD